MAFSTVIVTLYGIFNLVGGVIGYLKARSTASLIAGSIAGVILLACAAGLTQGNRLAALGSVGVALLLGGRFIGTWRRNHRIMPDLIMVLLSLATLVVVTATLVGR